MLVASALFFGARAWAEDNSSMITPGNGSDVVVTPDPPPDIPSDDIVDGSDLSADPSPSPTPDPLILVQGHVFDSNLAPLDQLVPIAGAAIIFINNSAASNNTTAYTTISDPTGFYSILLEPGEYTMISSAPSFETRLEPIVVATPVTQNVFLFPIPFNGFIAYAVNPVLETSPGRDVSCTIAVANSQVVDQMVTFSVVTPPGWVAWFPQGEALLVPSGQGGTLTFGLRYTGAQQGPHTMKVVVNGGAYFTEIPVMVVVKDLPFEQLDLFATSDCHTVGPGMETKYDLYVENYFQQGKYMKVIIQPCDSRITAKAWDMESNEITDTFFVYRDTGVPSSRNFKLRVFVPVDMPPGEYTILVTLCGDGVTSNTLPLHLVVIEEKLLYYAIFGKDVKYDNCTIDLYNSSNKSPPHIRILRANGTPLNLQVCATNLWDFPLSVTVRVSMLNTTGTAWPIAILLSNGIQSNSANIMPKQTEVFNINSTIPSGCISDDYQIGIEISRTDLLWTVERKDLIPITVHVTNGSSGTVCSQKINMDEYTLPDSVIALMLPVLVLVIILWALRWPKR